MQTNTSRSRVKTLEKTCSTYATEIGRLEFKVGTLQAEVNRLNSELARKRGVRHQAREFYRVVDDAVIARIDRLGKRRQRPAIRGRYVIAPDLLASTDKTALMKAAQAYDINAYFQYKPPKTGMKLQYRVLSKAYRMLRDTGLFVLKKGYRTVKRGA